MSNNNFVHIAEMLPTYLATLEEDDSYLLLNKYLEDHSDYYTYKYPEYDLEDMYRICNSFTAVHAKVKDSKNNIAVHSSFPLYILRYVLHEDLSFSKYYTVRRQPGYIVEGLCWSNGIIYQVREDKDKEPEIYELTISVDSALARMSPVFPK